MMLEGNLRTLSVFSGGFLEEGGDRGQRKMHLPRPACGRTAMGGLVRDWVHYKWKRVAARPAWAAGLGTRVNVSMCRGGTDVCGMAPCEAMLKIRARQTRVLQMLRLCFKISQARQRGRWAGGGSKGLRCPGDAHLRAPTSSHSFPPWWF